MLQSEESLQSHHHSLHFLRETLQCFPVPVCFHCLIVVSENNAAHGRVSLYCVQSLRGMSGACSTQAATITEKRRGGKGKSHLHLSLHLSAQDSDERSADSSGRWAFQGFNFESSMSRIACVNKGLSSLFFFTSSKF